MFWFQLQHCPDVVEITIYRPQLHSKCYADKDNDCKFMPCSWTLDDDDRQRESASENKQETSND